MNCGREISGERLPDARILQRNCSPVHFPPLSPSQKNYEGLLSITIDYYWKSSSSFNCCHISVTGLKPLKVRPVIWLCSSKLPIHSVIFLCFLLIYYISYYFCLRLCKSHPQENETFMSTMGQFSCTDSLLFKTEALEVRSIWSISWSRKSNRPKRDEHWSLAFRLNRVRCFIFGC